MRFGSDAIHVKTFWTQSPDIKSEKKKENQKKKKMSLKFLGLLLLNGCEYMKVIYLNCG